MNGSCPLAGETAIDGSVDVTPPTVTTVRPAVFTVLPLGIELVVVELDVVELDVEVDVDVDVELDVVVDSVVDVVYSVVLPATDVDVVDEDVVLHVHLCIVVVVVEQPHCSFHVVVVPLQPWLIAPAT